MAAGNVSRIIRAPGRIIIDPTDLSAIAQDGTYGGTEVGKSNQCALTPLGIPFRIESEALGEATDVLEPNNRYLFNCFLRGWDDDGIELLRSGGYELGTTSQHSTFAVPGSVTPGQSAIARAVILLYVPDDLIHNPAVLIYHGIPDIAEGAEFALRRPDELGITLAVDCLRDSNDNILRVGRLADLSLG